MSRPTIRAPLPICWARTSDSAWREFRRSRSETRARSGGASMSTESIAQPWSASRRRWLALTTASVFVISSMFPAIAALAPHPESLPPWLGILDVVVASVLVVLAFTVYGVTKGHRDKHAERASYRVYRV